MSTKNEDNDINLTLEQERKLKEFEKALESDKDFEFLQKKVREFNVFEVLKSTKTEIRHSNVIAWLMDPKGNHKLDEYYMEKIFKRAFECVPEGRRDTADKLKKRIDSIDYGSFKIKREWRNIDILAVSEEEKLVLCIENKIFSKDSKGQLTKYRKIIEDEYENKDGYNAVYVYLTPFGDEPINNEKELDTWGLMSYEYDILPDLDDLLDLHKIFKDGPIMTFIDNYCKNLRRYVVGDTTISEICKTLYNRYPEEFDLLFANIPDEIQKARDKIKEELEKRNFVEETLFSKDIDRYRTNGMSNIFTANSAHDLWYNDKRSYGNHYYYYEMVPREKGIDEKNITLKFYFVVARKNMPDEILEKVKKLFKANPASLLKVEKNSSPDKAFEDFKKGNSGCKKYFFNDIIIPREYTDEDIENTVDTIIKIIREYEESVKKALS